MSYRMRIDARASKAGRFISRVHKEIQKAFISTGMTQQELARKLEVNRATVNRRLLGEENLTLRSIADLAWGMDADIKFEMIPRSEAAGNKYQVLATETVTRIIPLDTEAFSVVPAASGIANTRVVQVGAHV